MLGPRLHVIDSQARQSVTEIVFSARDLDGRDSINALNNLLQTFGARARLTEPNERNMSDCHSLLVVESADVCPRYWLTPIRSLAPDYQHLVTSMDLLVTTGAGAQSVDRQGQLSHACDSALHVAKRFGRSTVIALDTDRRPLRALSAARTRCPKMNGIEFSTATLAEFLRGIVQSGAGDAVLAVRPELYSGLCDLLIELAGSEATTHTLTNEQSTRIVPVNSDAAGSVAFVIPAMITLLAMRGESDTARSLELSWLCCLEDGLATEGLFSSLPDVCVLSGAEFCQALSKRRTTIPHRLIPSIAPATASRDWLHAV